MSPDLATPGPVRPAAVVNDEIRTLLVRTGGWLSGADRAVYQRLIEEWATAVRGEIVEAA